MTKRIAGCLALLVFTFCLILGLQAENSFGTTVWRAVLAMVGTLVVGLVIGAMAEKMLDENLKEKKKSETGEQKTLASDR